MGVPRSHSLLVLIAGLGLILLAELATTRPAPLFDGIFQEDPYRYVAPPPGAAGSPLSVDVSEPVVGGKVSLVAEGTVEVPPQAQIIAQADAFAISAATTSVRISIHPSAPHDPHIVGNVYTFSATDQLGAPVALRPSAVVTIVLRAPRANTAARVARFDGTRWVPMSTNHGGLPDLYASNIGQFGDFAVVVEGAAASSSAAGQSAGAQAGSPAPSGAFDGAPRSGDTPTWAVILFAIAAVAVGLTWGVLEDASTGS